MRKNRLKEWTISDCTSRRQNNERRERDKEVQLQRRGIKQGRPRLNSVHITAYRVQGKRPVVPNLGRCREQIVDPWTHQRVIITTLYIARPRKYFEIYNSVTIYAVLPTGKVHPTSWHRHVDGKPQSFASKHEWLLRPYAVYYLSELVNYY